MAVVVVVLITGVNLVIVVFLALVVMAHVILVVTLLLFQLCSGANIQYTDQEYKIHFIYRSFQKHISGPFVCS